MRQLRLLRHRLRSLFHRDAVEDELARELSLHVNSVTYKAAGVISYDVT